MMETECTLKQPVHRGNEGLRCAVRVRQGVAGVGGVSRGEIGGEIGPTETVDRLLRVADQNQAARMGGMIEDALKDGELAWVGVL